MTEGQPIFMHRRGALAVLTIVCAVTCACGSSSAITLTNADAGRTITIHSDQEVDVVLQVTSYDLYGTSSISSGSVTYIDTSGVQPPNLESGHQLYRFRAVSVGAADISIARAPPNGFNLPPFAFSITVN
jgi:hypothetical protein